MGRYRARPLAIRPLPFGPSSSIGPVIFQKRFMSAVSAPSGLVNRCHAVSQIGAAAGLEKDSDSISGSRHQLQMRAQLRDTT